MASYDSASLLADFNNATSRPSVDEVTDATKYRYLAQGQQNVIADIAARFPNALYGAPLALTTADNKVFTFGTDSNGYALTPMGKVMIYATLANVPDSPLVEGRDYLDEGTQIRIPNDTTYTGTLYWRGITTPADISAGVQPVLLPPASRELIVYDAARRFQRDNSQPDSATVLASEYAHALARWMLHWRTQFRSGGAPTGISTLAIAMLGSR